MAAHSAEWEPSSRTKRISNQSVALEMNGMLRATRHAWPRKTIPSSVISADVAQVEHWSRPINRQSSIHQSLEATDSLSTASLLASGNSGPIIRAYVARPSSSCTVKHMARTITLLRDSAGI
eukprot:scaffold101951_cov69-Phaeocystis_antarctica.AAC.1